jgi:hypothetical protein
MKFLTPVLKENLELLYKKIRLPDYSNIDPNDYKRRARVIEIGALLPGLRMCERRAIILLSQSAPVVDLANLEQTLEHLVNKFEIAWDDVRDEHERILERCRTQLNELYMFVEQIEEIYKRREEATNLLDFIDTNNILSRTVTNFEPVYSYLGYEVTAITRALNSTQYPDVLKEMSRSSRPRDIGL